MRSIIVGGIIVGTLVLASRSALATEEPTGVEVGLRTGYTLPMGDAMGQTTGVKSDTTMSDVISGGIPIWIDAGYRLTPNVYVGGFFQYGILFINTDHETYCKASGISCSANDIMFGVNAHYHFMPNATFDPWAGIGVGYEIFNFSMSGNGTATSTSSLNGFQFVNVQLGGDYKPTPQLGVGPFVMFSLNQYGNCSVTGGSNCSIAQTALHEFLTFGIRGEYDIPVN